MLLTSPLPFLFFFFGVGVFVGLGFLFVVLLFFFLLPLPYTSIINSAARVDYIVTCFGLFHNLKGFG